MSEMSKAQGPVGGNLDINPTDDMVPPGAQSPRDPNADHVRPQDIGSEDVGPQDYGAEDIPPQDASTVGTAEPPDPAESSALAQSSSDPMPDIAGTSESDS
jgi:hypothetical protein